MFDELAYIGYLSTLAHNLKSSL